MNTIPLDEPTQQEPAYGLDLFLTALASARDRFALAQANAHHLEEMVNARRADLQAFMEATVTTYLSVSEVSVMTLTELNQQIEHGDIRIEDVTADMVETAAVDWDAMWRHADMLCPECHGKKAVMKRVPEVGHVYAPGTYEIVRSYLTGKTIWRDVPCSVCEGTGRRLFEVAS